MLYHINQMETELGYYRQRLHLQNWKHVWPIPASKTNI